MKHMYRLLVPLFIVLPLLLAAQASAKPILAAIITADLPRYREAHEAMAKILQTGGFSEDKLKVFVQTPNADKMSLANSLRRCQSAGAAVVVTYGSHTTAAALKELKETPLLFADVYDPVAQGIVKSLAAPGADVTGATSNTDLSLLLSSLAALKPVKKIGILYSKTEVGSAQQLETLTALAKQAGISITSENVRNPTEAVSKADKLIGKVDALFLTESISVGLKAKEILGKAEAGQCPVFSQIPGLVADGALIGLEAEPAEQGKLVAVHALQVLQGKKAHLLPVREPKKVNLKVNQSAADRLGLIIPASLSGTTTILK